MDKFILSDENNIQLETLETLETQEELQEIDDKLDPDSIRSWNPTPFGPGISQDTFKFIRKKQSNNNNETILANENFFLSPSYEIKLNNPKIVEINQKYIVFKYNDDEQDKLKNLSDNIINSFRKSILLSSETIINPLCTQYIRCTLPTPWSPYKKSHYRYLFNTYKNNLKYNIHSDNIKTLINYNLKKVIIEVKNIWKSDNKYGFNCIIKELYIQ